MTRTRGTALSTQARPGGMSTTFTESATVTLPRRSASGSRRPLEQLAGSHRTKASRSFGILAHLLGDLANPMHTDQTNREERIHSPYERAVDTRSSKRDRTYRFHYDGRDSGKPRAKAKHVAAVSHRSYKGLVRSYDRNNYSRRVHHITRRQLNRGANAAADVAAAIKAASKRIGGGGGGDGSNCSPAYPDACIPPPLPDLDCTDISHQNFRVTKHPESPWLRR